MQVCSTWQAVSRSDPLWHRLTSAIWGRTHRLQATWHEEYVYRHQTSQNFRLRRSVHETLHFDPTGVEISDGFICRCLTLSDTHLACSFADATLDGDINVAIIDGQQQARRAHVGNIVDGSLVDFTGCGRWWVGLYAGVPGRVIHIWDGNTEDLVYMNTTLTDRESLMGWHMLTELTETIGRVRVTSQESVVACTSNRFMVLDLRNPVFPLHDRESRIGLMVNSLDTNNEANITVDNRGRATVRRANTLEELYRFNTRLGSVMSCTNLVYSLMCAGGVIRVWEIEHGQYLYSFAENVGAENAMVGDDQHVAMASSDTRIHLWDFGAQSARKARQGPCNMFATSIENLKTSDEDSHFSRLGGIVKRIAYSVAYVFSEADEENNKDN
ncbi:hypothetical protein F3Y22_tig00111996pilonHSYRG00143 [Hibiscus syriacus]|uniref:Transcriptional regulator STERILE APETALA n=1 Tax=Hibiscus syriacus TaxID=106335 RepID=A0A6A2X6Y4_HIBSY|nr:hypothetical protein F3Y22_tig00111996pilonHSYRG00143 [Hibiscus syriacus]